MRLDRLRGRRGQPAARRLQRRRRSPSRSRCRASSSPPRALGTRRARRIGALDGRVAGRRRRSSARTPSPSARGVSSSSPSATRSPPAAVLLLEAQSAWRWRAHRPRLRRLVLVALIGPAGAAGGDQPPPLRQRRRRSRPTTSRTCRRSTACMLRPLHRQRAPTAARTRSGFPTRIRPAVPKHMSLARRAALLHDHLARRSRADGAPRLLGSRSTSIPHRSARLRHALRAVPRRRSPSPSSSSLPSASCAHSRSSAPGRRALPVDAAFLGVATIILIGALATSAVEYRFGAYPLFDVLVARRVRGVSAMAPEPPAVALLVAAYGGTLLLWVTLSDVLLEHVAGLAACVKHRIRPATAAVWLPRVRGRPVIYWKLRNQPFFFDAGLYVSRPRHLGPRRRQQLPVLLPAHLRLSVLPHRALVLRTCCTSARRPGSSWCNGRSSSAPRGSPQRASSALRVRGCSRSWLSPPTHCSSSTRPQAFTESLTLVGVFVATGALGRGGAVPLGPAAGPGSIAGAGRAPMPSQCAPAISSSPRVTRSPRARSSSEREIAASGRSRARPSSSCVVALVARSSPRS